MRQREQEIAELKAKLTEACEAAAKASLPRQQGASYIFTAMCGKSRLTLFIPHEQCSSASMYSLFSQLFRMHTSEIKDFETESWGARGLACARERDPRVHSIFA